MASIYRRKYTVRQPDGTTITKQVARWSIEYRAINGRRKRWPETYKDKAAARQKAAEIEREIEYKKTNLVDQYAPHKARLLSEHFADYLADLQLHNRDKQYIEVMRLRLNVLARECGWQVLADVSAEGFDRWRTKARKTWRYGQKKGEGASDRTLNQYVDTIRAFLNWCATKDRIEGVAVRAGRKVAMALLSVQKIAKPQPRRPRRALTPEQEARILAVAPPDRGYVYRVALSTGLRRAELENLQWRDVRLNAPVPFLQLRAQATKSDRPDVIPLVPAVTELLKANRPVDAADVDPVFPHVPSIAFWKQDLKKAGVPYVDASGRQADFHGGTRKTLATKMARANVNPKMTQSVMRHTDIRLTLDLYADHAQFQADAAALAAMAPNEPVAEQQPEAKPAAGA